MFLNLFSELKMSGPASVVELDTNGRHRFAVVFVVGNTPIA